MASGLARGMGAKVGAMMSDEIKIPAIWWGSGISFFESSIPVSGQIDIEVHFYRKTNPSNGQYIVGSNNDGNRFDSCVYTSTFWYFSAGDNSQNNYFSSGGGMVLNGVNVTKAHYSGSGVNYLAANDHTYPTIGGSIASAASPYIGARKYNSSYTEPSSNVGLISVDAWQNDVLVKSYRPYKDGTLAKLKDMVSGDIVSPLTGQSNLTFIDDITTDGVVL